MVIRDDYAAEVATFSKQNFTDGMSRPVSNGMRYAPNRRRAQSATERSPAYEDD